MSDTPNAGWPGQPPEFILQPQPTWPPQPGPVPGQAWPSAGAMQLAGGPPAAGFAKVSPFTYLVVGAGLLAFIVSFFSYYTARISFGYSSQSSIDLQSIGGSAWDGFFGWFGVMLLFVAAGCALLTAFRLWSHAIAPVVTLIASGGGLVFVLLSLTVNPLVSSPGALEQTIGDLGFTFSTTSGYGAAFWICLVAAVASVVGAVVMLVGARQATRPVVMMYPGFPAPQPQQWPPAPQPYQ